MKQLKRIYSDFEMPIKEIDENFRIGVKSNNTDQVNSLKILLKDKIKEIYSNLSRWQRVQLARHPNRPFISISNIFGNNFFELHGDRSYGDDPSVVTGIGSLGSFKVALHHQTKRKKY